MKIAVDDAVPRPRVVLPARDVGARRQLVAEPLERRPCHWADTRHIDVVVVELPAHLVWAWGWGWVLGHGYGQWAWGWGWLAFASRP